MLRDFHESAKSLSKNPLGIIALFIILIYGFAALVVGFSSRLEANERWPVIWFLVLFPLIVLAVFGWLVSQHYEKLYAPKDFNSDEAFLNALRERRNGRAELKNLDKQIEQQVKSVLLSDSLSENNDATQNLREKLTTAADEITNQIRQSAFVTVDARKLTESDEDVFEYPVSAFNTFGEFTNEIYFSIEDYVRPFEYGYSWVIRNPANGEVIKNARMITGIKAGAPLSDRRTLAEVGICPGMVFEIVNPKNIFK